MVTVSEGLDAEYDSLEGGIDFERAMQRLKEDRLRVISTLIHRPADVDEMGLITETA